MTPLATTQQEPVNIMSLQKKENVVGNGEKIGLKRKQTAEKGAKFWEKQYRDLRALRLSQQEKMTVAMKDEFDEHEKKQNEKIFDLEQQLKEMKEMYSRKMQKLGNEVNSSQQSTPSAEDALVEQAKTIQAQCEMISYYAMLTSTTLEICDDAVDCTVINHEEKLATKFRIRKNANGEGELRCEALANTKYLPEYLAANQLIEFEKTQCPSLMKDVLAWMFRDDGEEKEE